jgi:hypothetical protein
MARCRVRQRLGVSSIDCSSELWKSKHCGGASSYPALAPMPARSGGTYDDDEQAYHSNPMREAEAIEHEDEEEADALATFLADIRASKNCVKCFNIVLLVLGIGLTVFSFVGGELLLSLNWLAYALSGLGIALVFTTLLGVVGSCFDMLRGVLMLVSPLRGSLAKRQLRFAKAGDICFGCIRRSGSRCYGSGRWHC